ncbi:MAG: hypothetical protein NTZ89_05535 [Actinobacteria bacterium]|nr:hypothetical protein [Actinomycetota bacterium]
MPGFFRKTLTFLGFIDEDIEENIPQKYNESKRISKYSRDNKDAKLVKIEEPKIIKTSENKNSSWFRNPRGVSKLEEIKMEKKTKVFVIEPNMFEGKQLGTDLKMTYLLL